MIKFFRKIRQNLLSEGKTGTPASQTGRYFKYAIGEIILVVIGILIAIQINNWNEERKYRAQEKNLLIGLKEDLQESRQEIESTITYNDSTVSFYKYILINFENSEGVTPQLKKSIGKITNWQIPYLTYSTFESLKNKGLDLISNSSLRKNIIALYDNEFAYLMEDYDRAEWTMSENVSLPLANKYIRTSISEPYSSVPNNYETLRHNTEFINMTHRLISLRQKGVKRCNTIVTKIDDIIIEIDNEINSIN